MESKVSVPLSCPLACQLLADLIDMAEKPNGIMATAVISQAKWAHVAHVGPYCSALDQKDRFQQTAWQLTSICGQSYMCLSRSFSLSLSLTSCWTQTRTNSVLWLIASVAGCAIQPSNLCSFFILLSLTLSLSLPVAVSVHLTSDSVTEQRGGASPCLGADLRVTHRWWRGGGWMQY